MVGVPHLQWPLCVRSLDGCPSQLIPQPKDHRSKDYAEYLGPLFVPKEKTLKLNVDVGHCDHPVVGIRCGWEEQDLAHSVDPLLWQRPSGANQLRSKPCSPLRTSLLERSLSEQETTELDQTWPYQN